MSEAAHPSSGSRAATSSTSSELELIEQLKEQLAGPLFAAVSNQFSNFQNTVLSYQNKLQYAELKIRVLEERLRLVRIAKYGPGSEKLSDAQLELLELEPGVSSVGSPGRERAPCGPALDENEATASGAAGTTGESSACRADLEVHARAMRV